MTSDFSIDSGTGLAEVLKGNLDRLLRPQTSPLAQCNDAK
jgi:hypothetical protein